MNSNAIKFLKTPIDDRGGYRTYAVYPQAGSYVFECWDCSLTGNDGSAVGSRKAYTQFAKVEDALAEYEKYVDAWEPKG